MRFNLSLHVLCVIAQYGVFVSVSLLCAIFFFPFHPVAPGNGPFRIGQRVPMGKGTNQSKQPRHIKKKFFLLVFHLLFVYFILFIFYLVFYYFFLFLLLMIFKTFSADGNF